MPMARDEGFELAGHRVELLGGYAAREQDFDRLGIVVFLVGEHAGFLSACVSSLF